MVKSVHHLHPEESAPLRSVHTPSFTQVLEQLGISLVVSTYQAGKLIVLRADNGVTNTHFRVFQKPMGLAASHDRLAIGTAAAIWELRNVPATAGRVEPKGKHDACYLPRNVHITGDIDIHEMAWVEEELWFINTRFSCLCTVDKNYSFVPRWRPPFITAYDLRDRCHLNGLGVREGRPKYVTALGETNTAGGWRTNKAFGGILIDLDTNQILLRELSMPHSPRWYRDRLWVLESGKGSLAYLDPVQGELVTVAQLPGFTRGLDFCGDLAFIGLSQIRESAVFSGLPLTQTLNERICGVWAVDIRTGETIGFLRFEQAVQEIFAVSLLPGVRFPEVIDWDPGLMGTSYVLPQEALANVVMPSGEWEFAETYFNQGNKLYYEGQLEEAIGAYGKCLELQPSYLPARYNLGVTLGDLEQYDTAIQELQQVIAAEARHADAYNSLGFVYSKQYQLDTAIAYYERAIQIRPDFAKAHHNLGMTLLQQGQFDRGWAEAEWRWQTQPFSNVQVPQPRWDGRDILDKTLLIHTEQVAGDAIQFIRYVPMVAKRCRKIIVVCATELVTLFETVPGVAEIHTTGEIPLSTFDTYIALMSLPYLFQTTLPTIPAEVPYLQVPPQARLSLLLPVAESNANTSHPNPVQGVSSRKWGFQADRQDTKANLTGSQTTAKAKPIIIKIGLLWSVNPNRTLKHRDLTLEDFLPVLQLSNLEFYSFQVGEPIDDLARLPEDIRVHDLSLQLKDYGDFAAAIDRLDLIIGVDSAVVHLAGALGKSVWTLLSYHSDWRWLLDRDNSPWYPTMRLFRQSQPGDWATVVKQLTDRLVVEFSVNAGR